MRTYARIEDGAVVEVIKPLLYDDGNEIPIELRFPAFLLETLVDITDLTPAPAEFWSYDGPLGIDAVPGTFQPPS